MSRHVILLMFFCIGALASCSKSETPQAPAGPEQAKASPPSTTTGEPDKGKIDACALLTSKEIESIQGEPLKETKRSGGPAGDFAISQCYFALPTASKSISLTVTQRRDDSKAPDPKQFWNEKFHPNTDADKRGEEGEKGKKKRVPPEKIEALGDEAFWIGTRVGGDVYVLKGNSYIRISVGGGDEYRVRLEKSKALAGFVLNRL